MFGICQEQIREQDLSSPPLTATYVRGGPGGPCYLAISVHGIVGDNASRDILLTDIFTAFGQRLAGEDIALQPVSTSWAEWSQRCAALATHPAVVESRDFWLDTAAKADLRIGSEVAGTTGGGRPGEVVVGADCLRDRRDRRCAASDASGRSRQSCWLR